MRIVTASLVGFVLCACPTERPVSPAIPIPSVEPNDPTCTPDALGALYTEYVEPFVSGQVPSSCSQCHMTGIDISLYAQDTACDTMACMMDMDVVSLTEPEESEILTMIQMGDPASSAFDVSQEHQAILEWIQWSSRCHQQVCGEIESGCTKGTDAMTTGRMPTGQCSEEELLAAFWDAFVVHQNRCISCHGRAPEEGPSFHRCDDDQPCSGGEICREGRCQRRERALPTPFIEGIHLASDWDDLEHRRHATNAMYTLLTMDLIDDEEPLDSRLLTKPLPTGFHPSAVYGARHPIEEVPPEVGTGINHGGDTKFSFACASNDCPIDCRTDRACDGPGACADGEQCAGGFCRLENSVCDETYVQFLSFIQTYLDCQAP